ncbi:GPR158 [Lepeophtheirus salmonis]|uniref:GPR158 n=1 Tax=Lepeophtheirus salmonis TaxID=72036 RepID=A0A7R8CQ30_LEPSM|nr:GPR158 [Lepeophtheirus salmonis]CAF2888943.1 GPR158 [Lepeophtheirus salmonis]
MNRIKLFRGTSGIDIDLRRVDINQCQIPNETGALNIFGGTDKCKASTKCVSIAGLGFRRGSYKCICKTGFYFIDTMYPHKYFNGSVLEEEYAKKLEGKENTYDLDEAYQCAPCASGCDECVDSSPCIASLNWVLRTILLILQCIIICCLPIVVLFTYKYKNIKVVRAASPVILRIIILGAFFVYSTTIILYPNPNIITCTMRIWLREIGFALSYGALMLKTWRISVIFRVRSAKAIKITDIDLIKRLGVIVGVFVLCLFVRTLVSPPVVIVGRTADNLKAFLCQSDWWDHSFTILEFLFLLWGIRLFYINDHLQRIPPFHFFLMYLWFFYNIQQIQIYCTLYFFCHSQLTITILLCLIFASKFYLVMKGHGKNDEASWNSKNGPGKFVAAKVKTAQVSMSQHSNNTAGLINHTGANYIRNHSSSIDANKLTENEITNELERVFQLLQNVLFEAFKNMDTTSSSSPPNKKIIKTTTNNNLPSPSLPLKPSTLFIDLVSREEITIKEEVEEITHNNESKELLTPEISLEKDTTSQLHATTTPPPPHPIPEDANNHQSVTTTTKSCRSSVSSSANCSFFCCTSSGCSYCSHHSSCDEDDIDPPGDVHPSSDYGKRLEYFNPKLKRNKNIQTDLLSSDEENPLSYLCSEKRAELTEIYPQETNVVEDSENKESENNKKK